MDGDDFDDLFGNTDSPEVLEGQLAISTFRNEVGDAELCATTADTDDGMAVDPETHSLTAIPTQPAVDKSPASVKLTASLTSVGRRSLTSDPEGGRSQTNSGPTALSKVEAVFEEIADALLNERDQASFMLKRRPKIVTKAPMSTEVSGQPIQENNGKRICFPGGTEREAWRFAVLIRLLELVHQALRDGTVLSKRDIYYRDPALFGKQGVVDRYIDDIAFTFDVPRSSLNITAAAKGLLAGAVAFYRRDGTSTNAMSDKDGLLVPNLQDILSVDMKSVAWILVTEKEATFRSVVASTFWANACSTGIVITAKGYPDIATRAMLRFLCSPSPQNGFAMPAIHGLVDFDPDGLAILSTYKHGSNSLAHESGQLKVPQIHWLGLRSEHVTADSSDTHTGQGLLTLSTRDRRKAQKMLAWPALEHDDEARTELQRMLMLNAKAELQLLDATPGAMEALLGNALLL